MAGELGSGDVGSGVIASAASALNASLHSDVDDGYWVYYENGDDAAAAVGVLVLIGLFVALGIGICWCAPMENPRFAQVPTAHTAAAAPLPAGVPQGVPVAAKGVSFSKLYP